MRTSEQVIDYIFVKVGQRGWTQRELSERVGIAESTISRWRSHERDFSLNCIERFAEVLECSVEELLGLEVPLKNTRGLSKLRGRILELKKEVADLKVRKAELSKELEQVDVAMEVATQQLNALTWALVQEVGEEQ